MRGLRRVGAGDAEDEDEFGDAGPGWAAEEEDEVEAMLAEQDAREVAQRGASARVERLGGAGPRARKGLPFARPARVTGFGAAPGAVVGDVVERDVAAPAPPPGPPPGVGGRLPREAWPAAKRRDGGGPDLGRRAQRAGPRGRSAQGPVRAAHEEGEQEDVEEEEEGGAEAVVRGMTEAQIAESVAELTERLGEGRVEMLRKRGASRLARVGSAAGGVSGGASGGARRKGLAGGFFGARPSEKKNGAAQVPASAPAPAPAPAAAGDAEAWEMMTNWRWDLGGERVADPERERGESEDPACSCVELGAMARSTVAGQRAMAVQVLASVLRRGFGRMAGVGGREWDREGHGAGPDYAGLAWWTRLWARGLSKRGGGQGGQHPQEGEGDGGGAWPAPLPLLARLCLDDDNVSVSSGGAFLLRECLSVTGASVRAAALVRAAQVAFRGEERCPAAPMEKVNAATVARASKVERGEIPEPQDAVLDTLEVQHVAAHCVGNALSGMDLFWHEVWVRADSMFVVGGGGEGGGVRREGEGAVQLPKELTPKQAAQLCEYDPVQALVGTHLCARLGFLLSERSLLTFQAQTAVLDVLGRMAGHSAGVAAHVGKHADLLHMIVGCIGKHVSGNLCASAFRVFAGVARESAAGARRVLSVGAGRAIRDTLRWAQREEVAAMPSTYGLLVDILEFWRVLCRYGDGELSVGGGTGVPRLDDDEEGRGERLWELLWGFLDPGRPEGDRDPLYHGGELPASLPSMVGPHAVAAAVFSLLTATCLAPASAGGPEPAAADEAQPPVVGERVLAEAAGMAAQWVAARRTASSVRASAAHFLASLPNAEDHVALGTFLLGECCSEKFEARFCPSQRRTAQLRASACGPGHVGGGVEEKDEYLGFVRGAMSGGPGSLTRLDILMHLCVEDVPGADADVVAEADLLLAAFRLVDRAGPSRIRADAVPGGVRIGGGLDVVEALRACRLAVLARACSKRRRDPLSVMAGLSSPSDIESSLGVAPDFFLPALPSLMWLMDTADARLCVYLARLADAWAIDEGGKLEAFSTKFQTLVLCVAAMAHVGPGHEDMFLELLRTAMGRFSELTHCPDACVDALEGAVSGVCLNDHCLAAALERGGKTSRSLLAHVGGSFLPAPAHWPLLPLLEPLVDPAKASVPAMQGSLDLVVLLDAGFRRRDVQAWSGPTGAADKLAHILPEGVRLLSCMGACLGPEDDDLTARLVDVLWEPLARTLLGLAASEASLKASGLGLALITACGGRSELGKVASALTSALSLGLSMGDQRRALHAKLILVLLRVDGAPPDVQEGILSGLSGLEHLLDVDLEPDAGAIGRGDGGVCMTPLGDVGIAFARRHDVDADLAGDERGLLRHCVDALDRLERGGGGGAARRGRVHAALVEQHVLSFVLGTLCSRTRSGLPGRAAMLREVLMTLPAKTLERLLGRIPSRDYLDYHIANHLVDFACERCAGWNATEDQILRWCSAP